MWPIIKKAVNSDLSTPLNTLINSLKVQTDKIPTIKTTIGENADPASASGSLHAKINHLNMKSPVSITASDALALSADTQRSTTNPTPLKLKEISMGAFSGTVRISFDLKNTVSVSGPHAQIYKNGVAAGNDTTSNSSSWQTYTADFDSAPGDVWQLYVWKVGTSGGTPTVRNFRIYFTVGLGEPAVLLD